MKEINPNNIKKKLSGKYEHLYPIYQELCKKCFNKEDIKLILKTIYIIVDSNEGLIATIFWRSDALEIAIPPVDVVSNRILDGNHLKYQGLNNMIRLQSIDEVDNFVIDLFEKIYRSVHNN